MAIVSTAFLICKLKYSQINSRPKTDVTLKQIGEDTFFRKNEINLFLFAGYGHIVPKTPIGKIFTIFYAVIGIPLFLLYLSNIGQIFATSLKWTYSRLCKCQILRRHRRLMFQDKNLNLKYDFLPIGNTESRIFLPRYILAWWNCRSRKTPR